jgi:hypothetical protein
MMQPLGSTISRRSVLAAGGGIIFSSWCSRAAQKGTAFGLIGDRYHNSDYMKPEQGKAVRRLWNPEYIKLQHNAVRWLLRQAA